MRRDPVWIALAGPGSNLVLVALSAILLRIVLIISSAAPDVAVFGPVKTVLLSLIMVNLVLLLFNMIPIPPLDGHHVLEYFLPPQGQRILEQVGRFGILIAVFVAQPWLRFWLPRLYDLVTRFVTWGQS
jgi:Zn-dependent protease